MNTNCHNSVPLKSKHYSKIPAPGGDAEILWPQDKDCSKAPGAMLCAVPKVQSMPRIHGTAWQAP